MRNNNISNLYTSINIYSLLICITTDATDNIKHSIDMMDYFIVIIMSTISMNLFHGSQELVAEISRTPTEASPIDNPTTPISSVNDTENQIQNMNADMQLYKDKIEYIILTVEDIIPTVNDRADDIINDVNRNIRNQFNRILESDIKCLSKNISKCCDHLSVCLFSSAITTIFLTISPLLSPQSISYENNRILNDIKMMVVDSKVMLGHMTDEDYIKQRRMEEMLYLLKNPITGNLTEILHILKTNPDPFSKKYRIIDLDLDTDISSNVSIPCAVNSKFANNSIKAVI